MVDGRNRTLTPVPKVRVWNVRDHKHDPVSPTRWPWTRVRATCPSRPRAQRRSDSSLRQRQLHCQVKPCQGQCGGRRGWRRCKLRLAAHLVVTASVPPAHWPVLGPRVISQAKPEKAHLAQSLLSLRPPPRRRSLPRLGPTGLLREETPRRRQVRGRADRAKASDVVPPCAHLHTSMTIELSSQFPSGALTCLHLQSTSSYPGRPSPTASPLRATPSRAPRNGARRIRLRLREDGQMKPSDEEEYQRYEGMPASLWPPWEPGKGWPHGKGEGSGSNFPLLWHPIAWFRWRKAVRRLGPYAPDFKEFRQRH